jgi:thiol:disulfide interchange protein
MSPFARRASLGAALLAAAAALPLRSAPEYPSMGPDIYDVRADGTAQVAAAVRTATDEHKGVILVLGANWCIWCRRLHAAFENDPTVSRALKKDFVLVDIDVNKRNGVDRNAEVVARYGNPVKGGIPAIVVLDSDGKSLMTKDTDELVEKGAYSSAKIVSFLASLTPASQ